MARLWCQQAALTCVNERAAQGSCIEVRGIACSLSGFPEAAGMGVACLLLCGGRLALYLASASAWPMTKKLPSETLVTERFQRMNRVISDCGLAKQLIDGPLLLFVVLHTVLWC